MFDVKVGDMLRCNKNRPLAAGIKEGDIVKVVQAERWGELGETTFSFVSEMRDSDGLKWVGNNFCGYFEAMPVDLENK